MNNAENITSNTLSISNGVLKAYSSKYLPVDYYLARHNAGDWGQVSEQEKSENHLALENGGVTVSRFEIGGHLLAFTTQNNKTRVELAELIDTSVSKAA